MPQRTPQWPAEPDSAGFLCLPDEAYVYFRQAYATASDIKDASLNLIVNINLADLNLKRDVVEEARKHCRLAEDYLTESGLVNGHLAETKKIAGKISYHENDYPAALDFFDEALSVCRDIGAQYLEAEVLLERGTLLRAMNRHLDALADLEVSYHIYNTLKAEGKREQTEEVIGSLEKSYLDVFESMARQVDHKDKYTKGHSDRVAAPLSIMVTKQRSNKARCTRSGHSALPRNPKPRPNRPTPRSQSSESPPIDRQDLRVAEGYDTGGTPPITQDVTRVIIALFQAPSRPAGYDLSDG